MKKLLIALTILAVAATAQAELLATWGSFTGGNAAVLTANASAANAAEVTFGNLSRVLGDPALSVQSTAAGGFAANTWTGGGYFYFTADVASGWQISNAQISYRVNGTSTGPGTMAWSLNGTPINAGQAITTSVTSWDDSVGTIGAGLNSLTYAPVGTLNQAGTGAFAAAGGIRLLTSVTLDGDIQQAIPEPATMSLLGLGALAMVLRRKMKK